MRFLLAFLLAVVARACLPAPYLLVSFHGGKHSSSTINKYTRDGCPLPSGIDANGGLEATRSMIERNGQLYVADSNDANSRVALFDKCDASGNRAYLFDFVAADSTSCMDHPYGLAFDASNKLYVSNQDTNVVARFDSTGKPTASPSYLNGTANCDGEFAGFQSGSNGVRGVAFVQNNIWIASEDLSAVVSYNPVSGYPVASLPIASAVGVLYNANTSIAYVSSHDSSNPQVVAVNPQTMTIEQSYVVPGEAHPAGIAIYQDTLFVIGQDTQAVYAFNLAGSYLGPIVQNLPDSPEQILVTEC